MRLGGRLAAAIEILDNIEKRQRPAADALKDWGLSHRFAGAADRAAIGNIVYDALRRRRSAGWLFDSDDARALAYGALVLEWNMDAATLNQALDGDRFAPAMLSESEQGLLSSRDLNNAPEPIRADCPDWCVPMAQSAFGADWVAELSALAARPPLDLRVNTLLSSREKVLAELKDTGAFAADMASQAIRIPPIEGSGRHPNVQNTDAFRDGWFEIQDQGSQIVAQLADVRNGAQVLDYCAGAGGKTLALAAAMKNSGQIFAHDSEKQRLNPIFDRLHRAGARNVQAATGAVGLEPLKDKMDLVLVDAPCTGTGTWRRRPDAKWRLTPRQLDIRTSEQSVILETAKQFVKPGGKLVYITCSIFQQENRHQTDAFLAANKEFSAVDTQSLWQKQFAANGKARFDGTGIVLSPATSSTDGFYFAAMTKRADG